MQNKNYTFQFTQKSKSNTKNRFFQLTNKSNKVSFTILFLTIGLITFGILGLFRISAVTSQDLSAQNQPEITDRLQAQSYEYKSISYNRPEISLDIINNTGGPFDEEFQLSNESETEENSMENRLKRIEATSSPEFLPTIWAHLGKINNEYGFRRNPFGGRSYEFHHGMDIDGNNGDLIVAPANGTIVKAGWQGGYGNLIEIDHGNGLTTRYGHLSRVEVQIGDQVRRGQLIGLVGSTGRSTGPHLHYEVRLNDKAINPRRFLPPEAPAIKSLSAE